MLLLDVKVNLIQNFNTKCKKTFFRSNFTPSATTKSYKNNNNDLDTSFDDCSTVITMITNMSNSDDICITEVTSGLVTVTIKECVNGSSVDGFFK